MIKCDECKFFSATDCDLVCKKFNKIFKNGYEANDFSIIKKCDVKIK